MGERYVIRNGLATSQFHIGTSEFTPIGKRAYKLKFTINDGKTKYKARLVAKGFTQQQGVNFEEIFSPLVKMTTLHCVLTLATREDMELVQMDVKTTFLHGDQIGRANV